MKKFFISAALLLTTVVTVSAQTADEVINKYIDAIGGKAKCLSIKSLKVEGQIELQGIAIPFVTQSIQEKASRMDAEFQGMKIVEIVTPQAGWSMDGTRGESTLKPMSQDDLKTKVDVLDIQDQLIDYAQKGHKVEMLGKDEAEGNEYYKVKLTTKEGTDKVYFFDIKTYLPYKVENTMNVSGQEIKVEVKYLDYQTLENGVKRAFKQEMGPMMMVSKKITINPVIDETIFKGN